MDIGIHINNNYRLFIMSEDIGTEERNLKSWFRLRNLLLSIGLKYFSFDCIEVYSCESSHAKYYLRIIYMLKSK